MGQVGRTCSRNNSAHAVRCSRQGLGRIAENRLRQMPRGLRLGYRASSFDSDHDHDGLRSGWLETRERDPGRALFGIGIELGRWCTAPSVFTDATLPMFSIIKAVQ